MSAGLLPLTPDGWQWVREIATTQKDLPLPDTGDEGRLSPGQKRKQRCYKFLRDPEDPCLCRVPHPMSVTIVFCLFSGYQPLHCPERNGGLYVPKRVSYHKPHL